MNRHVAQRLLAFAATILAGAGACQDPEEYHRTVQITVGDAGADTGPKTGAAGTAIPPATGAAGTTSSGAAGTLGSTGAAGTTVSSSGAAGTGAVACPGCKVSVMYTCLSDASDQASFVVEAMNKGPVAFLQGELTLRYWFTQDAGKEPELNCDTARLGCQKVPTSTSQPPVKFTPVTPVRAKANTYFEITFPPGAVDVGGSTGTIQLRLHNKDFTPMNQSDDYSVDCGSKNSPHDSGKITAYIKGTLVGGVEP